MDERRARKSREYPEHDPAKVYSTYTFISLSIASLVPYLVDIELL